MSYRYGRITIVTGDIADKASFFKRPNKMFYVNRQ